MVFRRYRNLVILWLGALGVIMCTPAQSQAPFPTAPGAQRAAPVSVAGFTGYINAVALGVDSSGTVHVLWSGERSTDSTFLPFYSSSPDGVNWDPFQILDTNGTFSVDLAVDQSSDLVHLVYTSTDHGIYHRTVSDGVVSAATNVDDGLSLEPHITVNSETGAAYLIWKEWTDNTFTELSTYYSSDSGGAWSTPIIPYGGPGTLWESLAVDPSGAVMVGGLSGIKARSSLATDGTNFAVPVSVPGSYPGSEEDETAEVAYGFVQGTFHMLTDHFLEPGSSNVYHRLWDGSSWSDADNVSASASPVFSAREELHSSAGVTCTPASWMEFDDSLNTVLIRRVAEASPFDPVDLGQAFTDEGLLLNSNSRHAVTMTNDGTLHMVLGESVNLEKGLWYQAFEPLCATALVFSDGFDDGTTGSWTATVGSP